MWTDISHGRELAASRKQAKTVERYDRDKRPLSPLSVGDCVSIQNRSGTHPLRWDRTGKIVERLEHRQYLVKADGSGRVLLRTRAHLRKINPVTADRSAYDIDNPVSAVHKDNSVGKDSTTTEPLLIPGRLQNGMEVIHPVEQEDVSDDAGVQEDFLARESPPAGQDQSDGNHDASTTGRSLLPGGAPRRGARTRNPVKKLSPVMHGKHHEEVEV